MAKFLPLLLFGFYCSTVVATPVSEVYISLDVDLTSDPTQYQVREKIEFNLPAEFNATDDPLLLNAQNFSFESVTLNGKPLVPAYAADLLSLPAAFLKPGKNTVYLKFKKHFSSETHGFFSTQIQQKRFIFTNLQPHWASSVFPCFEDLSLFTVFHLRVLAPRTWKVIGNAKLQRAQNFGTNQRWIFEPTSPMKVHLFSLAAGPLVKHETFFGNLPLYYYTISKDLAPRQLALWKKTSHAALSDLQSWLGTPYPFKEYHQVAAPLADEWGMENLAASLVNETLLLPPPNHDHEFQFLDTVVHELTHQWIGAWMSIDSWNELFFEEGLVSFLSKKWVQSHVSQERSIELATWYKNLYSDSGARVTQDEIFSWEVYQKGTVFFDALEKEWGWPKLQTSLQRWLKSATKPRNSNFAEWFAIYSDGLSPNEIKKARLFLDPPSPPKLKAPYFTANK